MSVGSYVQQKRDSGMFNLMPRHEDLQGFAEFGKLLPKAAAAAQRRAINKTLGWLRTHIARTVGKQERIAIGAVRQRLRAYPATGSPLRAKLWFGINAIESSRVGRPRQNNYGVSVAGRRYQGAFYKKVYGGSADIWIRTASKYYTAATYPDSWKGSRRTGFVDENYNRFPLAKAKVSLEHVRPHFHAWSKRADQRLLEIIRQELNFELQKHLKGAARAG